MGLESDFMNYLRAKSQVLDKNNFLCFLEFLLFFFVFGCPGTERVLGFRWFGVRRLTVLRVGGGERGCLLAEARGACSRL